MMTGSRLRMLEVHFAAALVLVDPALNFLRGFADLGRDFGGLHAIAM
jgi:hypothetical protein